MTTVVEDVLFLRERTFMARTASAGGMQVLGSSRRWEMAVLGSEVCSRSVQLTQQTQGACAAPGEVEAEDRCDPQEGDLGLVLQPGGDSCQFG